MLSLELPSWAAGAPAFAAVVAPTGVTGYYSGSLSIPVVTGSVTCTALNGTAPYTYLWTRVGGSTHITASSSTSPTTTFKASPPPNIFSYTAQFVCQVTDATAAVVNSNIINVEIERNT